MFYASIGSFDLKVFDTMIYMNPNYARVFLIVFLLLALILLLNLIIALMSDTYAYYKEKSTQSYLYTIAKLKTAYSNDDERFSCLISGFVPFNIVVIPFVPFLLICKSKTLNTLILHILYLPVMMFSVLCFTLFSTLTIPIAYVISLLVKFKLSVHSMKYKLEFLIALIFGLPILIIESFIDWVYFPFMLYSNSVILRNKMHLKKDINPKILEFLRQIFISNLENHREIVP
jgi:hypothetical protein